MTHSLALALVASLVPALAGAQSARTLAPRADAYEVHDAWNAPVFATGAVVLGGSYASSAWIASTSDHEGASQLYLPVVGPWLALSDWGACPLDEPRCDRATTDKVLLVADGVFQAAGVITMITALIAPSSRMITRRQRHERLGVMPTRHGVAVFGAF